MAELVVAMVLVVVVVQDLVEPLKAFLRRKSQLLERKSKKWKQRQQQLLLLRLLHQLLLLWHHLGLDLGLEHRPLLHLHLKSLLYLGEGGLLQNQPVLKINRFRIYIIVHLDQFHF
jgi:hypothetical protein